MLLIGGRRFFRRPLPDIGHGQGRHNDQGFGQAVVVLGGNENPGQFWVHRQPCHDLPYFGEGHGFPVFTGEGDRPQLHQGIESVPDTFGGGGIDKGKPGHISQFQGDHAQNHLGKVLRRISGAVKKAGR